MKGKCGGALLAASLAAACGNDPLPRHVDTAVTGLPPEVPAAASPRPAPAPADIPPGAPLNADIARSDPGAAAPLPTTRPGGPGGADAGPAASVVKYTMQPPASLLLDGQSIQGGLFTVEEATAFTIAGGTVTAVVLVSPASSPVAVQAAMGDLTPHDLFDMPAGAEVLHLVGFFDPTSPDLAPTAFDVTIFGLFGSPSDCTVYLPYLTASSCAQVTGLGTLPALSDNVDLFFASAPPPSMYAAIAAQAPGLINGAVPPLSTLPGCPGGSSQMQPHGTSTSRNSSIQNCNSAQVAGSDTPETRIIELGSSSGTVTLNYNTYGIADQVIVTYEGAVLFDSGCVGASGSVPLTFSGTSTQMTVRVNPNCAGDTGTAWDFTLSCPS